jgi:hypothetical protein
MTDINHDIITGIKSIIPSNEPPKTPLPKSSMPPLTISPITPYSNTGSRTATKVVKNN